MWNGVEFEFVAVCWQSILHELSVFTQSCSWFEGFLFLVLRSNLSPQLGNADISDTPAFTLFMEDLCVSSRRVSPKQTSASFSSVSCSLFYLFIFSCSFVFSSLVCVFKSHRLSSVFIAFIPFEAGTCFANPTCPELDSVSVYPITD